MLPVLLATYTLGAVVNVILFTLFNARLPKDQRNTAYVMRAAVLWPLAWLVIGTVALFLKLGAKNPS